MEELISNPMMLAIALAGLALLIVMGLVFAAIICRLNDRRAVDRDEADQWGYGP